jgi:hypothetical protein
MSVFHANALQKLGKKVRFSQIATSCREWRHPISVCVVGTAGGEIACRREVRHDELRQDRLGQRPARCTFLTTNRTYGDAGDS